MRGLARNTRAWSLALAVLVAAAPASGGVRVSAHGDGQRSRFDAALTAYLGGDVGIIERTFPRSGDYATRAQDLDKWLEDWDPGKAVFVLDIARRAAAIGPRFTSVIVTSGRKYLRKAGGGRAPASEKDNALVTTWHRVAAALLQDSSDPSVVDEYVEYVEKNRGSASKAPLDGRLLLQRAVAQERRCWRDRPSLTQAGLDVEALAVAAGVAVDDDLDGLAKAGRKAKVYTHRECLADALKQFETAGETEEARVEARVRGGWILYQGGLYKEALDRLDVTAPKDDRNLAFWLSLFRGRTLSALGRSQEAAAAYRAALTLVPTAQSAGAGLALELVKLDRRAEADVVARESRAAGASGADPWSFYISGDYRLVDEWLEQMRRTLK